MHNYSCKSYLLDPSRPYSITKSPHQLPPAIDSAAASVYSNKDKRSRWLSIAASLLLSVFAVTYSSGSSADITIWDYLCKQSGVSTQKYNCHPAESGEWKYNGALLIPAGAMNMDSEAAVVQRFVEAMEAHSGFSKCPPVIIEPVGDWVMFTNSPTRVGYYEHYYIEYGLRDGHGNCERTGEVTTGIHYTIEKLRDFSCLPGEMGPYRKTADGEEHFCAALVPNNKCEENPSTPDPISITDGEKHFRNLVDAPILGKFFFKRSYSSKPSYSGPGILNPQREKGFTNGWKLNYEASVIHTTDLQATVDVYTVDIPGKGQYSYVEQASGEMDAQQSDSDTLIRLSDGSFLFKDTGATQWLFTAAGQLQGIHQPSGYSINIEYDAQGMLAGATDSHGRSLQIVLNEDGILEQVIVPDGGVFRYEFDDMGRLASIWTPDSTTQPYITYLHADPNRHGLITGIIGADGELSKSFTYDEDGRAIRSARYGDGGVEVESYALDFSREQTTVTDPLGTARTYNFRDIAGGLRLAGVDQPGGSGCSSSSSEISYDDLGLKTSEMDFNGHRSCYAYDTARRLRTTVVEGIDGSASTCLSYTTSSTALPAGARKVSYQWHPQLPLKTKIAEPGAITTIVYNGQPDPFNGGSTASCAPSDALLPDGSPVAVVCRRVKQATLDADGSQGFDATIQDN